MKTKMRIVQTAVIAAACAAGTAHAASIEWDDEAADGLWNNPTNWVGDVLPTSSDLAYITSPYVVNFTDGMTNTVNRSIVREGATLNITGGELKGGQAGNTVRDIVGQTSGHSYINQSGGLYNPQHILRIGSGALGTVNLSGGECRVTRGGNSLDGSLPGTSLQIGDLGTLNITNSLFGTRSGAEIKGVFHVSGAASTITIGDTGGNGDGSWYQASNAVLRVGISTNGVSAITLNDNGAVSGSPAVILDPGSILDVSFIDGALETNFWAVLDNSAGTFQNLGMVFDPSVDTNDWGYIVSNNVLYVGYGLGWPAGENVVGPPSPGRTIYWTGAGGDTASDNPTNWVLDTAATIPATWGPYDSDTWHIGNANVTGVDPGTDYVVDYDGTAVATGQNTLWVGDGAQGTLNFNSGVLSFNQSASSRQDFGFSNADGKGTLNMNGGELTLNAARFAINGGEGNFNLNGGTVNIGRQYADYSLQVGVNSGSTGTVTVTGGRIFTRGGVKLGADGGAATGIFSVEGSAATSLSIGSNGTSIDGRWVQYAGSVLKPRIDATTTGVTPIVIVDDDGNPATSYNADVFFYDGALLDVDWMPGVTNFNTFDVMTWQGQLQTNGLAFASTVDTNVWSFAIVDANSDGTNDTLRVTAYGETPNGTPYPWLLSYGLTADDDEVDNDGDGLLTWEEYVAGTIPTDPSSVLAITSGESLGGSDFVITWQSVEGKTYSVITNTSLAIPNKGTVASGIAGELNETSYTGTIGSAETVFYEIGVE